MTDSSQPQNTKKIIFIVTMAILSILLVVSLIFLVLAIKKERDQEKAKKEKTTEAKKEEVKTTEGPKKKKYDIQTELTEMSSEIMTSLETNNEIQKWVEAYYKEFQPEFEQGKLQGIDFIQMLNDFYIRHKQEVESVAEIILLCLKDSFQKKDPKFLKYIIKYFAGVFKTLKVDLDKELITIKEFCTAEENSGFSTGGPEIYFQYLIEGFQNFINTSIFDRSIVMVYLKKLNEESVETEYQRRYNIFIRKFDAIVFDFITALRELIESKIEQFKLDKNEDIKNIIKNLKTQEDKIYGIINSTKYELFDQADTKEIIKNLLFYFIIMHSHLKQTKKTLSNFESTPYKRILDIFDKLDLSISGVLWVELYDNVLGILERIIENKEYDVKKDVEVLRTCFEKIVSNKELCGSIRDTFISISEPVQHEHMSRGEEGFEFVGNWPEQATGYELSKHEGGKPETPTSARPTSYLSGEPEKSTSARPTSYPSGKPETSTSARPTSYPSGEPESLTSAAGTAPSRRSSSSSTGSFERINPHEEVTSI